MKISKVRTAVICGLLAASAIPQAAFAIFGVGDIVFDPGNYVQTSISAVQSVTQEVNQLKQLEQNVKSNIASFDIAGAAGLTQELATIKSVYGSAQELKNTIGSAQSSFRDLQSVFGAGNYKSWQEFGASIAKRKALGDASATNLYNAAQSNAKQVQAAYDAHQKIVSQSSSVSGMTEAAQSTTAAVGVLIQQQNSMMGTMSAMATAQALDVQEKTSLKEGAARMQTEYERRSDARLQKLKITP